MEGLSEEEALALLELTDETLYALLFETEEPPETLPPAAVEAVLRWRRRGI